MIKEISQKIPNKPMHNIPINSSLIPPISTHNSTPIYPVSTNPPKTLLTPNSSTPKFAKADNCPRLCILPIRRASSKITIVMCLRMLMD
jgi:hypothetical protein